MDGRRIIINYKESLPAEDMEDQGMSAVKESLFLASGRRNAAEDVYCSGETTKRHRYVCYAK